MGRLAEVCRDLMGGTRDALRSANWARVQELTTALARVASQANAATAIADLGVLTAYIDRVVEVAEDAWAPQGPLPPFPKNYEDEIPVVVANQRD